MKRERQSDSNTDCKRAVLTLLAIAISATTSSAQEPRKLDPGVQIWTVRQANFTRKFERAVTGARAILSEPAFAHKSYRTLRCDALLHLYFAQLRLKDGEAADKTFAKFLKTSAALPRNHALLHQMVEIREHFGLDAKVIGAAKRPLYRAPVDPSWRRASGDDKAVDSKALAELLAASRRAGGDGLLVVVDGEIIHEQYEPRYRHPMLTMSSVKSMTGLLVGLAIADGKIEDIATPIGKYLPEWKDGLRGQVTIEHLLTMTSGLMRMRTKGVPSAADKNAFVRALEPTVQPGTRWSYSNEGVQLLGATLRQALGEKLTDYARRRLFAPLGMKATTLRQDRAGNAITYADARTTLRDFARLGVVIAQDGKWNGKQVLPADWLERSLTPCAKNAGYGYLWWLHGKECCAMQGYLGTSVWIWPKKKLVVARVQSRPHLLADGPLDERAFRAIMARLRP